jgi:uridine kinase
MLDAFPSTCKDGAFVAKDMCMKTTIIGVAGPSGSGKTTIAKEIHDHYGSDNCITISSDNYYKDLRHIPVAERELINFDHPDSIDFKLLAHHLALLKQGKTVEIPTYDFSTHSRTDKTLTICPKPIIIVEGILAQHPDFLARLYDTKIFVDTDSDICFIRRLERDVSERGRTIQQVITQYKRDVKPMYEQFVAPCKNRANIVLENNDDNFATPEGVRFDISPLIAHLANKNKANAQVRFKLFSKSQTPASSADELSTSLHSSTIEAIFNKALKIAAGGNDTSEKKKFMQGLAALKQATLSRLQKKEANFGLSDCEAIANSALMLATKVGSNTVTQADVNQFTQATQKYKTSHTFEIVLAVIIGAAMGMIAGATIGFAAASLPGAIVGGVSGLVVGAGIAGVSSTMWHTKQEPLNKLSSAAAEMLPSLSV